MAGEGILKTPQKVAASIERLDMLTTEMRGFREAMTRRFERIEEQSSDTRERLTRLEAVREADRSQLEAELARIRTEAERAVMQLQSFAESHALPEKAEKSSRKKKQKKK
jgi:hypothetical protein